MSEENKNTDDLQNEEQFPVISFDDFDRNEELPAGLGDGVETVEGGLENYQQGEEETNDSYDLTFDEKKKYLRIIRKKEAKMEDREPDEITDADIENLSEEDVEKIKEFAKLRERKAIFKFVYHKKNVSDEDVKDLTDDEVAELTAKAFIMSQHLTYRTKKNFGVEYKKKRQRKNKMVKASRRANR